MSDATTAIVTTEHSTHVDATVARRATVTVRRHVPDPAEQREVLEALGLDGDQDDTHQP